MLLITKDDPPVFKVADFGVAKAVDSLTMLRVRSLALVCSHWPSDER